MKYKLSVATPSPLVRRRPIASDAMLLLVSIWLLAVGAQRVEAQVVHGSAALDLLQIRASSAQFYQTQAEVEQYRERERLQVPVYSSDLSKAVQEFRKHTADMHFRHVTCKICKDRVKEIRKLSKRIESAMK